MNARIVVGVDVDTTMIVLDWAAREASLRDAAVHLVSVWDPAPQRRHDRAMRDPAQTARDVVAAAADHLGGLPHLTAEAVCGDAGHVLVALSTRASLLVVGSSRQQGNGGLLLGGVAQHCVRQAHCPVTVVPIGWHGDQPCATELTGIA